jgi:protoporphyrinogen oxidase
MKDCLIVGGGIGGLYISYLLKNKGISFSLLESKGALGGYIDHIFYKGLKMPLGPRIFLNSRSLTLQELALAYEQPFHVIQKKMPRYLYTKGGLKAFNPLGLLKYPGLLKIFFQKPRCEEESIYEYFCSLGGPHVVDHVIEPLCQGIWAQDPKYLSMDVLMGRIKTKEFLKNKSNKKGLVVFDKGLKALVDCLHVDMSDQIKLNQHVEHLEVTPDGLRVKTNCEEFLTQKVVLATSFDESLKLLKRSHLIDESLTFRTSSVDVVTFYFPHKLQRVFGSGYLIPKIYGYKSRGVLFDADLLSYDNCDIISVFIQDSLDPKKQAYQELKEILNIEDLYEKAFVTRYPASIFSCGKGDIKKLQELEAFLKQKGIFLSGAFPKVGVCDVLDKASQTCETLTGSLTNIFTNKP